MHIPNVFAACFHVMVYRIGCNAADFHQSIVLYENCITGKIAMNDGRRTGMQITECR